VSDYGLDYRAIGVRSSAGAKDFFSPSSVSRPALRPTQPPVQWVPGVLSPGVKRGRGVTLTTHHYLVPRSRMSRSYISSPPQAPSRRVVGMLYFYSRLYKTVFNQSKFSRESKLVPLQKIWEMSEFHFCATDLNRGLANTVTLTRV
jgi:hypothetical protein